MLFYYCLFLASFIYGCNNIGNLNASNQTSNLYSSESGYNGGDVTSNQSVTNIILNHWHICNIAIQYRNGGSLKEIFVDPNKYTFEELKQSNEYIDKISMLKIQDEKGNTLFHNASKKGYTNFLTWILKYLYACSPKELKDTEHDIKEVLNIKNKELCTVLHTGTINNRKGFIKVLVDHGYISKDNAKDTILATIKSANHLANNAVKFLQGYINKNDILENLVQSTVVNQDNDLTENDNINHVTNNGKSIYRTTPLHTFAKNGDIDSARQYLDKLILKEKIEEVYYTFNKEGHTSFNSGLIEERLDFVAFLLNNVKAPEDILNNSIKWGITNQGTWKEKHTFASQDMIALLKHYDRDNGKRIRCTVD